MLFFVGSIVKLLNTSKDENNSNSVSEHEQPLLEKEGKLSYLQYAQKIFLSLFNWTVLILMNVLPNLINNEVIVFSAIFSLSAVVLIINGIRFQIGLVKTFPKILDVGLAKINLALLIYEIVAHPSDDWSRNWNGTIINLSLALLVILSIILGKPFTIQYAMDSVLPQYWDTPSFKQTNYFISSVWAALFLVNAGLGFLSLYLYPTNTIAKVVPPIVLLVAVFRFSSFYPAYVRSRKQKQNQTEKEEQQEQTEQIIGL
jgi:hypothetical protein